MNRLTIHNNRSNNATIISNRFIDIYMKEANDVQLKIYLYLLRMTNTDNFTSIPEIVEQFNHTEKDVIRSLKYWETKDLLSLDYNSSGALISISLKELKDDSTVVSFSPGETQILPPPTTIEEQLNKSVKNSNPLQSNKDAEDMSQLLFIAEQYLGKTLTSSDLRSIYYIHDELCFTPDFIDFLIQYCVERGKKEFRYIETVARNWHEQNITTPEEAASTNTRYTKTIYSVMKALGKSNEPTEYEVTYIKRWAEEYGFAFDIIQEACNRTVQKTDTNRFQYTHSILSNWYKQGVTIISDIEKCDHEYKQSKVTTNHTSNIKNRSSYHEFKQNTYDYDALKSQLINKSNRG